MSDVQPFFKTLNPLQKEEAMRLLRTMYLQGRSDFWQELTSDGNLQLGDQERIKEHERYIAAIRNDVIEAMHVIGNELIEKQESKEPPA